MKTSDTSAFGFGFIGTGTVMAAAAMAACIALSAIEAWAASPEAPCLSAAECAPAAGPAAPHAADAFAEELDRFKNDPSLGGGESFSLQRPARPSMTLEGFTLLVDAASNGLAEVAPAKDFVFADYQFAIKGMLVGLYWEETAEERSTEEILTNVVNILRSSCSGEASSAVSRADDRPLFATMRGYALCARPGQEADTYSAVSVLDFGASAQVFVSTGLSDNRDILDIMNSNLTDVEAKIFEAIAQ